MRRRVQFNLGGHTCSFCSGDASSANPMLGSLTGAGICTACAGRITTFIDQSNDTLAPDERCSFGWHCWPKSPVAFSPTGTKVCRECAAEADRILRDIHSRATKQRRLPRPQFSLRTLLWLMVVVAAFFAGAAWQRGDLRQQQRYYEDLIAQFKAALNGAEK